MVAAYKVIKRCIKANCRGTAMSGSVYCEEHQLKPKLQVCNPKGYNQYNKNPIPPEPTLNQLEKFERLTEPQQRELLSNMGNLLYRKEQEIAPLKLQFYKYKRAFEAKLFKWDWMK